jgi:hypothetical protein
MAKASGRTGDSVHTSDDESVITENPFTNNSGEYTTDSQKEDEESDESGESDQDEEENGIRI